MKTNRNSSLFILCAILAGIFMLLSSGCKKDSDDNNTPAGSIKDKDGNVYHTVSIGDQTWLLENLKTTHYNNGDPINPGKMYKAGVDADTAGAWLNYYNNDSIAEIYGRLYNFYVVNDPRGIAPEGYHVPTDEEWFALEMYLGNDSLTGGKLKEAGFAHWQSPNAFATNSTGFTALPAGSYAGFFGFVGLGMWNSLWTSTSTTQWYADARGLVYTNGLMGGAHLGDGSKSNFFSIRCVQDVKK